MFSPSLELVIKPNGSKLWRLRYYRPLTKQRNMISFGSWPEMSLAEAREKRSEAKSLLLQSIDPQHHQIMFRPGTKKYRNPQSVRLCGFFVVRRSSGEFDEIRIGRYH
ncbi:integrase arm-type DNA-binding domain-containing protein [Aeromonas veronii]|uniref:integrase arm-type DNA-binding domain-containing protein n=1 Tax=Aeromonas veronii TaxID=654 RepID=UPI003B9F8FF6